MMRPTDPLIAPSRGTAAEVIDAIWRDPALLRPADTHAYLTELERLCALVGFDFPILVAQWGLETGDAQGGFGRHAELWGERLNPGGIGVGDVTDLGYRWATGPDAARAHMVHMAEYVLAPTDLRWNHLRSYIALDYRFAAIGQAGWTGSVRTIRDLAGKWASLSDYAERICARSLGIWPHLPDSPANGGTVVSIDKEGKALTFGRLPHPPYDRLIVTKRGPGFGYSQVAARDIVGTCVHRTWGYGSGEFYQAFFSIGGERHDDALVDYYIDRRGRIVMLNDPRGNRAPWANGDANGLEGDGPRFVEKLGVGAINARLVSIETEGKTEPLTPETLAALAWLIAYWHDQDAVPWDQFPFNPATDCVTQMQHYEFSSAHKKGSGCPFSGVQGQTDEYQAATAQVMKRWQQEPAYVDLDPPGLVAYDGTDRQLGKALLWACRRTFTARKPTPVHQYADRGSGQVRAPLAIGEAIKADYWLFYNGEPWVLTETGARVPVKDATPVVEFKLG